MTSAANHEAYGDPRWSSGQSAGRGQGGGGPWGQGQWGGGGFQSYWMPPIFAQVPKPVLIVLMVLGFIVWWPVGLALLAVMLWRKHVFGCGGYRQGGWQQGGNGARGGWKSWGGGMRSQASSGNRAFDEYRTDTLRRLEDEQKEFAEFLDRLRFAKDKSEFDQFMNDRRNRPPEAPPEQSQGPRPA